MATKDINIGDLEEDNTSLEDANEEEEGESEDEDYTAAEETESDTDDKVKNLVFKFKCIGQ
jgi:hypothetical protein